jgi:hypothetical protein
VIRSEDLDSFTLPVLSCSEGVFLDLPSILGDSFLFIRDFILVIAHFNWFYDWIMIEVTGISRSIYGLLISLIYHCLAI